VAGGPIRSAPTDFEEEVVEDLTAPRSVSNLRVELHPEERPPAVLEGGDRRVGTRGGHLVARRRHIDVVAMAHPHRRLLAGPEAPEQPPTLDPQVGPSVLAAAGAGDVASRELRQELHPVAETEHGRVQLQQLRVGSWDAFAVDRVGPSRKNDALRFPLPDPLDGAGGRMDLAIDVGLPDAPGDQLGVLGAEVDDQDSVVMRSHYCSR
jgi:hypothetical protein